MDFIGAKGDGGGANNWRYNTCKAPVKSSPPTNQHTIFYRAHALPVAQPTVSEHWREKICRNAVPAVNTSQRSCSQLLELASVKWIAVDSVRQVRVVLRRGRTRRWENVSEILGQRRGRNAVQSPATRRLYQRNVSGAPHLCHLHTRRILRSTRRLLAEHRRPDCMLGVDVRSSGVDDGLSGVKMFYCCF